MAYKSKLEKPLIGGDTCEEKDYLEWLLYLKDCGVEIALHNVTNSSSTRQDIKGVLIGLKNTLDVILMHMQTMLIVRTVSIGEILG